MLENGLVWLLLFNNVHLRGGSALGSVQHEEALLMSGVALGFALTCHIPEFIPNGFTWSLRGA